MNDSENVNNNIQEPTNNRPDNEENTNGLLENNPIEINDTEIKNDKNTSKETVSILKFILNVGLSFLVWNYVILTLFNLFVRQMIIETFSDNLILMLITYNVTWILTSIITIFLSYNSNKKKTIEENKNKLAKNILLAILFIFIIVMNYENIISHLSINLIVSLVMILLHIIAICFFNNLFYNKYIENAKIEKIDIIILLIYIGVITLFIMASNFILNKKYSMTCVRATGETVDISFDTNGIKNVTIDKKELSSEELVLYKMNFISSFTLIQIGNEGASRSELIEEYMEEVSEFEENNKKYGSYCSYDD